MQAQFVRQQCAKHAAGRQTGLVLEVTDQLTGGFRPGQRGKRLAEWSRLLQAVAAQGAAGHRQRQGAVAAGMANEGKLRMAALAEVQLLSTGAVT